MLLTPTQKLEDILKALGLWETHRTYNYLYPFFPDKEEKACSVCQNLILLVYETNKIEDKQGVISRIKDCKYSVTPLELDSSVPPMEEQEREFEKRRKAYYNILDEIHKTVTRR